MFWVSVLCASLSRLLGFAVGLFVLRSFGLNDVGCRRFGGVGGIFASLCQSRFQLGHTLGQLFDLPLQAGTIGTVLLIGFPLYYHNQ
jgi:hypothetical protein